MCNAPDVIAKIQVLSSDCEGTAMDDGIAGQDGATRGAIDDGATGRGVKAITQNADLARTLAREARARGREDLAVPVEAEAMSNERYVGRLLELLGQRTAGQRTASNTGE